MTVQFIRLRLAGILLPLLFGTLIVQAQSSSLDKYVAEGLKNNLVLQQKDIDIKKAFYALKYAESLFQPAVSFLGSYQTGAGGRSISLPVGDLMNPVYATLNQLTASDKFPAIKNVEQDFIANNFFDAKIRTTIPIFNRELNYNKKIQQQKVVLEQVELDGFKLELAKKINVAYYTYCAAIKVIDIYESALNLSNENLRTNERLLKNGKGLSAYVLRSQSEQETNRSRLTEAKKTAENALLYFNFLLNRNGDDSINIQGNLTDELNNAILMMSVQPEVASRPEIRALKEEMLLHKTNIRLNESNWMPKINGSIDIGSQAGNFNFNSNSKYYNAGIQLEMPIFSGNRNSIKIKQAKLDKQKAELNLHQTSQQLSLSAATVRNNLIAVYQNYQSALKRTEAASSYQRLIERGFREGINTFIEDIDARNVLTTAQLQANIDFYNVLIAAANLQAETASLKF